jgi:hypothetical protein
MADDRFPRPVLRTQLYEQVAEQITGWISQPGRPRESLAGHLREQP